MYDIVGDRLATYDRWGSSIMGLSNYLVLKVNKLGQKECIRVLILKKNIFYWRKNNRVQLNFLMANVD